MFHLGRIFISAHVSLLKKNVISGSLCRNELQNANQCLLHFQNPQTMAPVHESMYYLFQWLINVENQPFILFFFSNVTEIFYYLHHCTSQCWLMRRAMH